MNGGVMGPGISDLSRHAPPPYFHDHGGLSGVATENSPRSWKRRTQGAFRTWHHIPHRRSSHDPEDLPYPLWKSFRIKNGGAAGAVSDLSRHAPPAALP